MLPLKIGARCPAYILRPHRITCSSCSIDNNVFIYWRCTGYFNIYNMPFNLLKYYDYTEKRDLYQAGGINSGSPTIMDYAREHGVDFFLSDWRAAETENLAALHAALTDPSRSCTFAYLYMASMQAYLGDNASYARGRQALRLLLQSQAPSGHPGERLRR